MSEYTVRINGKDLKVILLARNESSLTFKVGDQTFDAQITARRLEQVIGLAPTVAVVESKKSAPPPNTAHVQAPMPGTIVKILVQPSQKIALAEPLLIMEAMKMENHVKATREGTVKEIFVREGDEVRAGQALVEFA